MGVKFFILFTVIQFTVSQKYEYVTPMYNPQPDVCQPGPKGRVPWILHVREPDYGWREHTHRANIALAVNEYKGPEDDMRKMRLQLEVEITRALFWNASSPIHDSDLALYIHALLATNRNPRNFQGTDLVADLLHRVNSAPRGVNPYLILALCNAHVVTYQHLEMIEDILTLNHDDRDHPDVDSRDTQLKAIAYKAFACAISLNPSLNKFNREMDLAANCLKRKHNKTDGSFGNVYTTSLAVQAFTASNVPVQGWNEQAALEYLEKQSVIEVNLIKAYYIEMALNARRVKFIKDLYNGIPLPGPDPSLPEGHYIHYTVKKDHRPEVYYTITIRVSPQANFFEIMEKAAKLNNGFGFSSYLNQQGQPMIYALAGIPNDAEENKFWRLCRQHSVDHNRHVSEFDSIYDSPKLFTPAPEDHILFLYLDTECPMKS